MSETLEKLMMLNQMNRVSPDSYAITPHQRSAAQGDALIRLAAEMGNPKHSGSGFDRTLTALIAGLNPAMDAYNAQEQSAIAQNASAADQQRKTNMDILREDREKERMRQHEERENRREQLQLRKMGMDEEYNKKYLEYLQRKEGQPQARELPEGIIGRPYETMSKNEQTLATKDMKKELNMAIGMKESLDILDKMKGIMAENPDLWRSFTLILEEPDERKGGLLSSTSELIKKNVLMNEKDRTAINKFRKLSSELVVKGAQAFGGKDNFTDARQKLIESMKPSIENTPEANSFVIDNMADRMREGPEWEKALRYGLQNGVMVVRDPDFYIEKYEERKQGKEGKEGKEGKYYNGKIEINGALSNVRIPHSELKAFLEDGGVLDEE